MMTLGGGNGDNEILAGPRSGGGIKGRGGSKVGKQVVQHFPDEQRSGTNAAVAMREIETFRETYRGENPQEKRKKGEGGHSLYCPSSH